MRRFLHLHGTRRARACGAFEVFEAGRVPRQPDVVEYGPQRVFRIADQRLVVDVEETPRKSFLPRVHEAVIADEMSSQFPEFVGVQVSICEQLFENGETCVGSASADVQNPGVGQRREDQWQIQEI